MYFIVYFSKTVLISFWHTQVNSRNVYIFVHICKRWPDVLLKVDVCETHWLTCLKYSLSILVICLSHTRSSSIQSMERYAVVTNCCCTASTSLMSDRWNDAVTWTVLVLIFNRTYLVKIIRHQMFLKIFVVLNCYSIYRAELRQYDDGYYQL